jgi:hypothetical protein
MGFLGKLLQGVSYLPAVITGVENLFSGRSGADKKNAALGFVTSALSMTDAIAAKDVIDPQKFTDGLSKIIDGVVQCLNASVWAKKAS